jgi:hypothetical protein
MSSRPASLPWLLLACLTVAACGRGGSSGGPATITPAPLTGAPAAAAAAVLSDAGTDAASDRPRISIDPSLTILQVLNVNLDTDPDEEQVIAVKKLDDVGSPVRIIVADADPTQGAYYYQSWEGDTNATDPRVFSLSVKDIVGDHGMQILASGLNEAGLLTLDVFRSVPPSSGRGLAYKAIFQLVANEISVQEVDRPDTYSTEGKPGPSFPIQAFLRDPDSQNVLDLVSIRYTWNSPEARYTPGPAEKIPGENAQQTQLSTLYLSAGADAFERFLSGSWVQVPAVQTGKKNDSALSILDFDPRLRTVSLATPSAEDIYDWKQSQRTIYKTLQITGENETVPLIQLTRTFRITADSPNSITVEISSPDLTAEPTTNVYTRVTDDIRDALLNRPDARAGQASVTLDGRYSTPDGLSLDFSGSRVTWSDASGQKSGGYVLFSLGTATILTIQIGDNPRTPGQTSSWLVNVHGGGNATPAARTLALSPVRLTVSGYEDLNGPDLLLTQVVDVKK